MPEVVNSVGNVVMRHFKHYITERSHRWLKEDNSLEEEDTDWPMNLVTISMEFLKKCCLIFNSKILKSMILWFVVFEFGLRTRAYAFFFYSFEGGSLILRRPRSFAASSLPLSPSPVWYTLCEVVFMTSEPFVNFHQSERMYHILRSVECMECNPKWKVSSRLCKTLWSRKTVLWTVQGAQKVCFIRRVACIPDGSFSSRRNHEATMDLQWA